MVVEQEAPGSARTSGRPRVVVYDPVTWNIPHWSYDVEAARLADRGVDLIVPRDVAESDAAIVDADVVVVTAVRGQLNAAAIATIKDPIGFVCASIGMNQVDHDAARARNVPIRNVPFCVDEVSDHALTLLLMAERRAVQMANLTASGEWNVGSMPEYVAVRRLRGRTLGIIGTGRIGKEIARKAQVFGYRTIGYDPNVPDPGLSGLQNLPLATVMSEADAIVTAADLNPTSRGIIGRESLSHVRPGTLLINIARGGLVDEAALAEAMRDGRIALAALDVRDPEPPVPGSDHLAGIAPTRLILTPHMAGASVEARETLHTMTADVVLQLLEHAGRLARA